MRHDHVTDARAALLSTLSDGRAYTPRELAGATRMSTADARRHLQMLERDSLVTARRQGPHGYFQLSGPGGAEKTQAGRVIPAHIRTGPKDPAMRATRVCYGHLAGPRAVGLFDGLVNRSLIAEEGDAVRMTVTGRLFFISFGVDVVALESRRDRACKTCLDWTERRSHLGGPLAAALLDRMTSLGWLTRDTGSRGITFSAAGEAAFDVTFNT